MIEIEELYSVYFSGFLELDYDEDRNVDNALTQKAAYSLGVLDRRAKRLHDINEFEKEMNMLLGGKLTKDKSLEESLKGAPVLYFISKWYSEYGYSWVEDVALRMVADECGLYWEGGKPLPDEVTSSRIGFDEGYLIVETLKGDGNPVYRLNYVSVDDLFHSKCTAAELDSSVRDFLETWNLLHGGKFVSEEVVFRLAVKEHVVDRSESLFRMLRHTDFRDYDISYHKSGNFKISKKHASTDNMSAKQIANLADEHCKAIQPVIEPKKDCVVVELNKIAGLWYNYHYQKLLRRGEVEKIFKEVHKELDDDTFKRIFAGLIEQKFTICGEEVIFRRYDYVNDDSMYQMVAPARINREIRMREGEGLSESDVSKIVNVLYCKHGSRSFSECELSDTAKSLGINIPVYPIITRICDKSVECTSDDSIDSLVTSYDFGADKFTIGVTRKGSTEGTKIKDRMTMEEMISLCADKICRGRNKE